ncbi:MAG: thioesterase family protein [candidate division NC10 bacterium]|nr:thioesterase family protein [candidate division NC10 bacterium]
MDGQLTTRMTFEKTMVVTDDLAPKHMAGQGINVLSTPELIRFVELCALEGVRPYLRDGQDTVGTEVNIKHLAGTPMGMRVTARCTLVGIDRRRLSFTFEVHDELDKVGEGTHDRFIMEKDRQQQRLREKVARWKDTTRQSGN